MRVLGIDPGVANTGYGLVLKESGRLSAVDFGAIRTPGAEEMSHRLDMLYQGVRGLLERLRPDVAVLERLFFNTNQKTALSVGQACGVILLACKHAEVPCAEYTPLQVKKAVAGNGRADKKQVRYMVCALLKLGDEPSSMHASDALAAAICHLNNSNITRALGGAAT